MSSAPAIGQGASGFLVVDKPGGMTSNQVVARVKRATGIRKVGHAGTLDPMATGVLVMGLGGVTRLIRFIQAQPKEYLATARFGVETDTLDAEGEIISRQPMDVDRDQVAAVLPRFIGDIDQVPPMVSALKQGGRRLYQLAKEGQTVDREARPVEIHELELLSVGPGPYPEVGLRVVCGKGTYLRSLADDIAAALGGRAHLIALRRTRVGRLTAESGIRVEDLESWTSKLLTPSEALADLPAVRVNPDTAAEVRHGRRVVGGELAGGPEDEPFRVINGTGSLLAVYRRRGEESRPEVVLPG